MNTDEVRNRFEKSFPAPEYLIWVKAANRYLIPKDSGFHQANYAEYRDEYNDKWTGYQQATKDNEESMDAVIKTFKLKLESTHAENERLRGHLHDLICSIELTMTAANKSVLMLESAKEALKEADDEKANG